MTTTVPETTARSFTRPLLAYCLVCKVHYGSYVRGGPGEECINDCREAGPRLLVPRRLWLCSACGCTARLKRDLAGHECGECD